MESEKKVIMRLGHLPVGWEGQGVKHEPLQVCGKSPWLSDARRGWAGEAGLDPVSSVAWKRTAAAAWDIGTKRDGEDESWPGGRADGGRAASNDSSGVSQDAAECLRWMQLK
jgi:hypothetical protein